MTVIKTSLFSVLEKFPDHKKAVGSLYRESESFQTLCEDYQICAAALRRWSDSASEEAPARREEYAELFQDLEAEILQCLDEFRYTYKKGNISISLGIANPPPFAKGD